MANLREVALGVASVLGFAPKPLPLVLRGQTMDESASLVRQIVRECVDANARLAAVEVDQELLEFLASGKPLSELHGVLHSERRRPPL
jgi:hypothetical protein